ERPASITPRGDGSYLIRLDRSVATIGGLVSFPVEVVYSRRAKSLSGKGTLGIHLPRVDIPIAYGSCEVYLPAGLDAKDWHGPLRRVKRYSSETAEVEFEYGRGHVARPPEPQKKPRRPLFGARFMRAAPSPPKEDADKLLDERDKRITLARNYWRAGKEHYENKKFKMAREQLSRAIANAPKSGIAENARRLITNIDVATGKTQLMDRGARAAGRQIRRTLQAGNVELLGAQQELLKQAKDVERLGDFEQAAFALEAAEDISEELVERGEDVREQHAVMRGARKALEEKRAREEGVAQLWKDAKALRKGMRYKEAVKVLDKLLAMDPMNERAKQWRDDMQFLQSQLRKGRTLGDALGDMRDDMAEAVPNLPEVIPREQGSVRYLRDITLQDWVGHALAAEPAEPEQVELGGRIAKQKAKGIIKKRRVSYLRYPAPKGWKGLAAARGAPAAESSDDVPMRRVTAGKPGLAYITDGGILRATKERARALSRDKRYDEALEVLTKTEESLKRIQYELRRRRPGTETDIKLSDGGTIMLGALKFERKRIEKEKSASFEAAYGVEEIVEEEESRGRDLARFLERNYAWALQEEDKDGDALYDPTISTVPAQTWRSSRADGGFSYSLGRVVLRGGAEKPRVQMGELLEKLRGNLGQKVLVESQNIAIRKDETANLGIHWKQGNNDVVFAVIDEGQFRALLELEGREGRKARVAKDERGQETIVGTDALLANRMRLNIARAADAYNKFDYLDNPVRISHERYLLISNDGYVTAVRAGPMHHWTEQIIRRRIVAVPQTISVPRVGRLFKFEKALIRPEDVLAIEADYKWKGEER
ncbi:MAG: hypothetical protein QGD94_06550, partial [Planctomycetia bacterium]|nr:hypothetical protein [Planctomycetia bacterium]